jgi:NADH:ubiquinone oxidoreductase subunit 6 (subunit J)
MLFGGFVLLLGRLGVVLLINPIYYAFPLGFVFVCISLFYFVTIKFLLCSCGTIFIYVGSINILIISVVMFVNGFEWLKYKNYWTT